MKALITKVSVWYLRVSSFYFFLFFPIFWPASYFLLLFQETPSFSFFRVLLGTQKHFEIFETKLPIKLINSTKKLKLHVKKDQFEAFLSDFLLKLVGQKGKQLTDKQQKLLEKAISSTANSAKKRAKLRLPNLLKERKQYTGSVGLLVVDVQKSWLASIVRKTYIW